jgi:hypothetical protein
VKKTPYLLALCLFWFTACQPEQGCTDPSSPSYSPSAGLEDGSCEYGIELTQAQLSSLNLQLSAELTGTAVSPRAISHNLVPSTIPPDSSIRIVWGNTPSGSTVTQGSIYAKRIIKRNPDGTRGVRLATVVMVKQYPGYFPEGGDFDYYFIPWQTEPTTESFPNGIIGLATISGKVAVCANCHRDASNNDFLYHR